MPPLPRSQHFATLVAGQPGNELFRFSLAQALLLENRPEDAIEHLVVCVEKKPEWMMPRILLGRTFLGLGRRTQAKPWLEQALQLAMVQSHEDPEKELRALLADLSQT